MLQTDMHELSRKRAAHGPYLKSFGALLKCLCPLGAKGAARYVLYVASIDHALPVALNVRFLLNVQSSL